MLPRRTTGEFGQNISQRNDVRNDTTSSLPLDSPSATAAGVAQAGATQLLTPPNLQNNSGGRKRGRPEKKLNSSAKRGLTRLFVEASRTPFEQITEAFDKCGGFGRLWSRKFFQGVTGAGPDRNLRLKDIRFNASDPSSEHGDPYEQDIDSTRGQNLDESPTNVPHTPLQQLGETGALRTDSSADEARPRRKAPRKRKAIYARTESGEQDARTRPPAYLGPQEPNPFNASGAALEFDGSWMSQGAEPYPLLSGSDQRRASTLESEKQLDEPQSSVKFQSTPQTLPKGKKSNKRLELEQKGDTRKRNRKAKPKRRTTTLSLTNMAMWLDGGVKGRHYKIVKEDTISRTLSLATSEFNMYYRTPTFTNALAPTTLMYPLPGSVFTMSSQVAPPPAGSAIQILTTAWASRLHDTDVKEQLEKSLPDGREARESYVNTRDDRKVSPLHLAVAYGYPHTCRLLMEGGAELDAVTNQGTTIYDFAQSASRKAGENIELYFRILHCRTFVRKGEQPPAPGPKETSTSQPEPTVGRKRSQQAMKSSRTSPLPQKRSSIVTAPIGAEYGAMHGTVDAFTVPGGPGADPRPRTPSFATNWTESPTLSTFRGEHSTPSSVGHDPSRNFVLDPLPLTAPPQPEPSYLIRGADALEASGGNLYRTGEAMHPYQYPARPPTARLAGNVYPYGYGHGYMYDQGGAWPDAARQRYFPDAPQVPQHMAYEEVTYTQAAPQPTTTYSNSPAYGPAISAQSTPDVPSMTSRTGANQHYPGETPPNTYHQRPRPPSFIPLVSEPLAPEIHHHQWLQPPPPPHRGQQHSYNPPSMPPSTAQNLSYAPMPAGGSHTNDTTSLLSYATNTSRLGQGQWACLFGDPQCRSAETICPRCLDEYMKL